MKKLPVLSVVCVALLLFAVQAHAAPLDSAGLLDNILQKFHDAASHWQGKIISYASWLFWILALLSMTWTFGMMALKNPGITEALAEIIRFFAVTGFFWWLLVNGPAISTSIIDSMRQISAEASGLSNSLSPSGIVDIGFDIVSKVVDQSSMWSPVNSGIGLILAGIVLICLVLVGVNMLLLLVSGWMLAYGGVFLLGFGGGRWTSDIAISFYKTVLGIAIQIFAMILLVGIGKSFIDQYYAAIQSGNLTLKGLFVMLAVAVVLLALVNKVPPMMASPVGGGSTGGIGTFGAGPALGAAATAAVAAATAGAAVAAGATSMAGGASALKAAFQQAQQHMTEGSGMFSGSGSGSGSGSSGSSGSSPTSGGSGGFKSAMGAVGSAMGRAGKFAADMSANLAKGAGAVAKDKAANMMDAAKDKISQTTGGKVASAISNLSSAAQQSSSNTGSVDQPESDATQSSRAGQDSFAGDSLGAGKGESQSASMNEEVAAFVNKDQPASA